MNDLAIVIFSCDKNEELWPIFRTLLNKYWPNHPKAYLLTETKSSSLFGTIVYNYDLQYWTLRIRECLKLIDKTKVIFICDDVFLNAPVNIKKLNKCIELLDNNPNLASINFEMFYDPKDIDTKYYGFRQKTPNSLFVLSFLCGIWNKDKLIDLLSVKVCDPWTLEDDQNYKDYDYYIVSEEKVLSWFRDGPYEMGALYRGKWNKDVVKFLEEENIKVDFDKKGFRE